MKTTKDLQWYVPDEERRQACIAQLEACETMDEVLEKVVAPMIADEGLKRIDAVSAGRKAFFDAIQSHLHLVDGGSSFSTYYRRYDDRIKSAKESTLRQIVNHALAAKGKEPIDLMSLIRQSGNEKALVTIDLPLSDEHCLRISAKVCEVELRKTELRGFNGIHALSSMCTYELQGSPAVIAQVLQLYADLSDEDTPNKNVRVHYLYKSVDRRNRTLEQAITLALNS